MGVLQRNDEWERRRCYEDLLYLRVRRGTQAAQGRGLQNLHSWVRIPPAPPIFSSTYAQASAFLLTNVLTEFSPCGFLRSICSLRLCRRRPSIFRSSGHTWEFDGNAPCL